MQECNLSGCECEWTFDKKCCRECEEQAYCERKCEEVAE